MVLVTEFRIPLPLSVEEYERAQLYAVVEVSREETHGQDSGVEILKNEPYENEHGKGQYTHKIYHLGSKVPRFIAALAPASALKLEEEAWNGYPHCKTVLTSPFLGERFHLTITSLHEADAGTQQNVHKLDEKMLKERQVVFIDVANDELEAKDYDAAYDPKLFKSATTGRGPLEGAWQNSANPIMCCYKLVEFKFRVFPIESRVESFVSKFQRYLFLRFHRKLVCLMDKWFPLSMKDIRELEAAVKEELAAAIAARQQEHAGANGSATHVGS